MTQSKGFGGNREQKYIARLAKALKSRDYGLLENTIWWGYDHLGKKVMSSILSDIYPGSPLPIDNSDAEFFWQWQVKKLNEAGLGEMAAQKAKESLIGLLREEGCVPGQDFSMDGKGDLLMSNKTLETLLQTLDPNYKEEFAQKYTTTYAVTPDLRAIATNVGFPGYFDRLFVVAKERLMPWFAIDDGLSILEYLTNLMEGTLCKFPELRQINLKDLFLEKICDPQAIAQVMEKADDYPDWDDKGKTLSLLWQDMVEAATGQKKEEFFEVNPEGQTFMSIEALKIVGSVWESPQAEDGGYPMREIIAHLEAQSHRD